MQVRRNAVCAKTYIADDEQNIRELLQEFLKADYTVEVFETGDAPMQRFAAVPADLVVLDIMMPGTDGFTICSRIRKISYIPIIYGVRVYAPHVSKQQPGRFQRRTA